MIKRDEQACSGSCWNTAGEDDIVFVLKQKDKAMANTIRFWAAERVRMGLNRECDIKITEALETADSLDRINGVIVERIPPTTPTGGDDA